MISVVEFAQLLGGIGALGALVAPFVALKVRGDGRGTEAASTASRDADELAGDATRIRTEVLLQIVVDLERSKAAMRQRIITCPVTSCPTRRQLMQEDVAA